MKIPALLVCALLIEFLVICSVNLLQTGKAIYNWYKKFHLVAVLSDVTSILIGIMIADFLVTDAAILTLMLAGVVVQVIHDVLFFLFVVQPLPRGKNSIIDMFKDYADENSYTILFADAAIILSTILLYSYLKDEDLTFLGISSLYAITYIMYTNR